MGLELQGSRTGCITESGRAHAIVWRGSALHQSHQCLHQCFASPAWHNDSIMIVQYSTDSTALGAQGLSRALVEGAQGSGGGAQGSS